jgi:Zn-dependent protease
MFNFIEPGRTPWDLQFYVGRIPVRVHPLFWVVGLVFASGLTGIRIPLAVAALFVSILVHELGHALVMEFYGERPRVVLYWLGGLAISGGDLWDLGYRSQQRSPQQQIIISFAGPAAGFLLAAAVIAIVYATGGWITVEYIPIPLPVPNYFADRDPSPDALFMMNSMLFINVSWGLVNLLPVFPLDGGQIARAIFVVNDPWQGVTRSLWLSLVVGAAVAVYGFTHNSLWTAMLFGSMAFGSWQMLQNSGRGGRPW